MCLGVQWLLVPLLLSGALDAQGSESNPALDLRIEKEPPLGLDWEPSGAAALPSVDAARVALGRSLFFDGRLSRSRTMSCASCHVPELAFTDGRARFRGDDGSEGGRNVPSVLNRALGRSQFWDGRVESLAEQALGPMLSSGEMALTQELFRERFELDPDEGVRFQQVFGAPPTLERAAQAIAAFEATLLTAGSPFDRFEWLGEVEALSAPAQRGLALFRGRAGCTACHMGTNFTDEAFHNVGVASGDDGRERVTGRAEDRGKFKTPTLRNVARTAPYMHDGSLPTLLDVVRHYEKGGQDRSNVDKEVRPLVLSEGERAELVAFLESLSGQVVSLDPSAFAARGTLVEAGLHSSSLEADPVGGLRR